MFLLDEASFSEISSVEVEKGAKNFCDYVSHLRQVELPAAKHSSIYDIKTRDGINLVSLLYDDTSPLEKSTRQRLILAIDRTRNWDSERTPTPVKFGVELSGLKLTEYTISEAFEKSLRREASSCVIIKAENRRYGWFDAKRSSDAVVGKLHFSSDTFQLLDFYRNSFEVFDRNKNEFLGVCLQAFPNLVFHDGLKNQLGNFSRSYQDIRPDLIKALAALNDYFCLIYSKSGLIPFAIEQEFSAKCGFGVSPESSKTRKNKKAMAKRSVSIAGKGFICEWHVKLLPERDRIYFMPNYMGDKILVGVFHEHLPT